VGTFQYSPFVDTVFQRNGCYFVEESCIIKIGRSNLHRQGVFLEYCVHCAVHLLGTFQRKRTFQYKPCCLTQYLNKWKVNCGAVSECVCKDTVMVCVHRHCEADGGKLVMLNPRARSFVSRKELAAICP